MYTDIKTFEDACLALGIEPENSLPIVSALPEQFQKPALAHAKLVIIVAAVNGGWVPDYQNMNQLKFEPWFDLESEPNNPDGFRLVNVNDFNAGSHVGSRLCFESREKAEYTVEQFLELYKDLLKS